MSEEKILYASDIIMLDPRDCGSTIAYRISKEYSLNAEIILTDCYRKIGWDFGATPESIVKINKAIKILEDFKRALKKASKSYNKEKSKEKKDKPDE